MSGLLGKSNLGGGVGKAFAAISVTYPAGSICTCSNGSKTLKAKDTSGSYLFLVPSGGEWTVSITDGTQQASTTVNATMHGVYTVTLGYILYIYDSGKVDPYEFSAVSGTDVSTDSELGILVGWSTQSGYYGTMAAKDGITIPSGYTRLCFSAKVNRDSGYFGLMKARRELGKATSTNTVAIASTTDTEYSVVTIDVSSLAGESLFIAFGAGVGANQTVYVNQIYFAP